MTLALPEVWPLPAAPDEDARYLDPLAAAPDLARLEDGEIYNLAGALYRVVETAAADDVWRFDSEFGDGSWIGISYKQQGAALPYGSSSEPNGLGWLRWKPRGAAGYETAPRFLMGLPRRVAALAAIDGQLTSRGNVVDLAWTRRAADDDALYWGYQSDDAWAMAQAGPCVIQLATGGVPGQQNAVPLLWRPPVREARPALAVDGGSGLDIVNGVLYRGVGPGRRRYAVIRARGSDALTSPTQATAAEFTAAGEFAATSTARTMRLPNFDAAAPTRAYLWIAVASAVRLTHLSYGTVTADDQWRGGADVEIGGAAYKTYWYYVRDGLQLAEQDAEVW